MAEMITLKTLPKATAQEVFDQGAAHLLKQGVRSVSGGGSCRYRGIQGRKCVGGCYIADDEYERRMEDISWDGLIHQTLKTPVPRKHAKLIRALQRIHDEDEPSYWKWSLRELAKKMRLKFKFENGVPE